MKKYLLIFLVIFFIAICAAAQFANAETKPPNTKIGDSIPAKDHPNTERYFVRQGVEFVFIKGSLEAMKANSVSLNETTGRLFTPNEEEPYIDLLAPQRVQRYSAYIFLRLNDGRLLLSAFLRQGGIAQQVFGPKKTKEGR